MESQLRVGLAQMDVIVGDFATNAEKILDLANRGVNENCDLVVFPELSLFGYLPMDLLERKSVFDAQLKAFKNLEKRIPKNITLLVGLVTDNSEKSGKPYQNGAALLRRGQKTKFFFKELLPNYDVFDDPRFFEAGRNSENLFRIKNKKILVTICEDIWGWGQELENANYKRNPLKGLKKSGVDLVVNLSASPYSVGHRKNRQQVVKKTAKLLNAPVVYVNMVGGQDEVVFDGGSFAVDKTGKVLVQNSFFKEDFGVFEIGQKPNKAISKEILQSEELYEVLSLGIRDFVRKTGFKKVHLGSSGGIDSALVAALAVNALGPENVVLIAMPGPFSSPDSLELSQELSEKLNTTHLVVDIVDPYQNLLAQLEKAFGKKDFGVMNENLQARLRGLTLMAYSNANASMLLSTGNKSEYATGYATLYGDMCGGLAPIADLLKTQVYEVANFINRDRELIPREIIDRAPTAELRPNQKDQDSLPPYDKLDAAIKNLVVNRKAASNQTEEWLLGVLSRTEFKRWQAPPVLRVSPRAFGKGRRYPVAHKALF